jgi:predicted aconitate hydratase
MPDPAPRNLTRKLLDGHLVRGELRAGEEIEVAVDQILIEDATGTMCCLQFEALEVDRSAVPLSVMYVDHNTLQLDTKDMEAHRYLKSFSERYGLLYSPPGNGISHSVHLERFSRPGALLLGADSHTSAAGAVGSLAIGAGGLEVAVAMAGYPFGTACPEVAEVKLVGSLPEWVQAKDIMLELLRRHGVRGGLGRVFEFTGDGVATLSATERATICNMIVETAGTTAIFPSDERVREWLEEQERLDDFVELAADPGASYDSSEAIDLSALEPLVARPHSPGNVVTVAELAGLKTAQVCVGSSVNSSFADLAVVAAVLREQSVHRDLQLTVTPGSRQILDTIARSGVYRDLVAAGARILEPVCGPCIGVGQAPAAGLPSVRTFNRNFPGRSGTEDDEVYLCSPATAAATAIRGEITDPRTLGRACEIAMPPSDPALDDRQILPPLPLDEAVDVKVQRGPSIVPPPRGLPVPDTIEGRVAIVVGDDVSTGDMAPDGAIGMSLWSNIAECAKFMFQRQDPEFPARALDWGGGLIVGGHNYGQGSSREVAALAPLHLGIRAVVAKSFARIHRRNLICQGIVPLTFADEAQYAFAEVGQGWRIAGVRAVVGDAADSVVADAGGAGGIELNLQLSERERDMLLAGGLLAFVRSGGLTPVALRR